MTKSVSKSDLAKSIEDLQALDVVVEGIDRNDTSGTKQTKLNNFTSAAKKQIKEERDVLLIAIKVK
jgi:hypothetical protein